MANNTLEKYTESLAVYKNYGEKINDLEEEKKSLAKGKWVFFYGLSCILIFLLFINKGGVFWASVFYGLLLPLYPGFIIWALLEDFLINLISGGKLNSLKREIKNVRQLRKIAEDKLRPFEQSTSNYYQAHLEEFFKNNLYKKRSGSQEFEESLSEFQSMIGELSVLNNVFVTTHVSLREYREYLSKRTIDHNFQTSKNNDEIDSIRSLVKSVSEQKPKKKEIVPPERLYRIARKIDWEGRNKKNGLTGREGEEIALVIEQEYLESIGRKDLSDRAYNVALKHGDGLGYDLLSFFADGKEKYIEVKSTTNSLNSPYYLSRNELDFLKEHHEDYFLYRILISNGDTKNVLFKSSTSAEVLETHEITPVNFMVKEK